MKRLIKKKAGSRITLYHNTSVAHLEQIVESGQIVPGGYTGNTSAGTDGGASGNQNAIYLSNAGLSGYARSAVSALDRSNGSANFGVSIQVSVDEDALGPDFDDMGKEEITQSDVLAWKQSLDEIGQCLHEGPIFVDEITGVKYLSGVSYMLDSEDKAKLKELFGSDYLLLNSFMEKLKEFDDWYLNIKENDENVASITNKRLIKKSSWVGIPKLYIDEGPNNETYEAGSTTTTAIQKGEINLTDIENLPGCNGEVRQWEDWTNPKDGQIYRYFGDYREDKWNKFLDDIKQNGIQEPIHIIVEKDGSASISEGNHRVQAAKQLGLTNIPVEIQYMGNSQRFVTQFGLGEGNYTYDKRGWQN